MGEGVSVVSDLTAAAGDMISEFGLVLPIAIGVMVAPLAATFAVKTFRKFAK